MTGAKIKAGDGAEAPLALWHIAPGVSELRPAALGTGAALVRMTHSALSRGTERLVRAGRVPGDQHAAMRGPAQEGDFPFPVKYGYCAVGVVEQGPPHLIDRHVFALHPHQTHFRADPAMLLPLPPGLPPARATLTANMETALNAIWDARIGPGDRVAVIGAGAVGCLVARLAARHPGAQVFLTDTIAARARIASELAVTFLEVGRDQTPQDMDVVLECSATAGGMAAGLGMLGLEGTLVSVGWHGSGTTPLPLGGAFHSKRLRILSSQVGRIPPDRAPRWDYRRRMGVAARLLAEDPALDALIGGAARFADLPRALDHLLSPDAPGVTSVVTYD
ncbi:MAG: NADPH:quinone reductase-like Zn-dependent oxidoreductase [Paracoccaceae bacterium]|jgi:NADPH:quinone reductase-like Zn-dependent oxidoreductase